MDKKQIDEKIRHLPLSHVMPLISLCWSKVPKSMGGQDRFWFGGYRKCLTSRWG
jgi:hypothetical protein